MNYSKQNNDKRRKNYTSAALKTKNKIGILIFRTLMALLLVAGFATAGIGIGAYFGIIENSPVINDIQAFDGSLTSIVYDANGEEIARFDGGESREYAKMSQIPSHMKYAFVALEDERFYSHDGVDIKGFIRGVYQAIIDEPQGGSTITQQLIKNKLGIKRNSIETKLQEQYLAVNYEKELVKALGSKYAAKEKILELYMNIIPLGNGQNGVQAAALYYFGKDVSELTLAESCVIAPITNNPYYRDPIRFPDDNRRRQLIALDNMLRLGFITQQEYDEAKAEDVYSKIQAHKQVVSEQPSFHSYYVDQVFDEVSRDLQAKFFFTAAEASDFIYNAGLQIYSAQDSAIQEIVDEAYLDEELFSMKGFEIEVTYEGRIINTITGKLRPFSEKNTVKKWEDVDAFVKSAQDKLLGTDDEIYDDVVYKVPQPQSAMVILDYHTGHVAAISGGRGKKPTNRGLNRATVSERQPGSVFKVLAAFAPAIDLGYVTPATVFDDVPVTFKYPGAPDWTPTNWYSNTAVPFRGLSTVRLGVQDSMNIVAAKTMDYTGLEASLGYVRNFGITTLSRQDGLATSLGGITRGVTQLEVTAAFGAIANQGVLNTPVFYTKVLDRNGEVILETEPSSRQVLKKTSAFLLTDMMKDVITRGTGGKAGFKNVKMPVAGKTGTTSDTKDLMFVGYTPYYAAGIYIGYDMPDSMTDTTSPHLRIWSGIMEKIHANLEYKDFPRPDGITTAQICKQSGKLAEAGLCDADPRGSEVRTEYFAAGTVPSDVCDVHMRYKIDETTGKIPTEYCPEEYVKEKVGIVRPIPYTGSAVVGGRQYEVPAAIVNSEYCTEHSRSDAIETTPQGPLIDEPYIPEYVPTSTPSFNQEDFLRDFYNEHQIATPTPSP